MEIKYVSIADFKKAVPALSRQAIKQLCESGKLPCFKSGNRIRINLQAALECLSKVTLSQEVPIVYTRGRPPDSLREMLKKRV